MKHVTIERDSPLRRPCPYRPGVTRSTEAVVPLYSSDFDAQAPNTSDKTTCLVLSPTDLALLLGGIELASARRRKHYRCTA